MVPVLQRNVLPPSPRLKSLKLEAVCCFRTLVPIWQTVTFHKTIILVLTAVRNSDFIQYSQQFSIVWQVGSRELLMECIYIYLQMKVAKHRVHLHVLSTFIWLWCTYTYLLSFETSIICCCFLIFGDFSVKLHILSIIKFQLTENSKPSVLHVALWCQEWQWKSLQNLYQCKLQVLWTKCIYIYWNCRNVK